MTQGAVRVLTSQSDMQHVEMFKQTSGEPCHKPLSTGTYAFRGRFFAVENRFVRAFEPAPFNPYINHKAW